MTDTRLPCPGRLDGETGRTLHEKAEALAVRPGDRLVLEMSGTDSMDARGGAWVVAVADAVRARHGEFAYEGQRGEVADFMNLIGPGLVGAPSTAKSETGFFERVGETGLDWLGEFNEFVVLTVDTVYWTFIAPFEGKGFRWGLWADEVYEMGVRGVRINCLMNFLLGMIIAMLSAAQLEQFGAGILVADLVVIAFARELAAVMTATVVAARTGAAIAAELATMKVQEEIDALRGMGLNVAQFLVAPKVLALLLVMPCLAGLGMIAGLLGSAVWGVLVMGHPARLWYNETMAAAEMSDVFQGFLKTLVFAVMIVLIGCHNGLRVRGGSRGVGLMTTRAVVMDIFFIIVIDMVLASVFYYMLD